MQCSKEEKTRDTLYNAQTMKQFLLLTRSKGYSKFAY